MSCDEKGIDHVLGLMRKRAIEAEMTPEELMRLLNAALICKQLLFVPPSFAPGHYPADLARVVPATCQN